MKKVSAGQGDRVNVNLEVNGVIVCTIVFGEKSGHPFSGIWDGSSGATQGAAAAVFGDCALLAAQILSAENHEAMIEFMAELLLEDEERKSAIQEDGADDGIVSFPF